jgi:hypothetical protein
MKKNFILNIKTMRTTLHQIILLIAVMLLVQNLPGQTGKSFYDSVLIIKPKEYKNIYKFTDSGAKEIQFSNKNPKLVKKSPTGMRDLGDRTWTALTGIRSNSETDGFWEVEGTIKCNDTLPDWSVKLFCEGYQTEDRERVKNDDGSWSVDTKETNFYYWDKNANGLLMEGTDTIGIFMIIMNPREDTLLKHLSANIFEQQETPQNFNSKNHRFFRGMPAPYIEYATFGNFRGKNLVMIRNSSDRKVWIYMDDLLTCMFQSDIKNSAVNRKNSQFAYLFINSNIPSADRRNQFRLAIMSRFLLNSFLLK